MAKMHSFQTSLQWSVGSDHELMWDAFYRKAFPNLVNHMPCLGDTDSQRMGIDRLIHLSNGETIQVDEKLREKDYGDILLEYISVDKTGAPGWIEKDLNIDYLAYAILPTRIGYLFPWRLLRRAWGQWGEMWIQKYGPTIAPNNGYNTVSVAVPVKIVQKAIWTSGIIVVP